MDGATVTRLTDLRVVFGHQSVGRNIVDGVRDIVSRQDAGWPIVELHGLSSAARGWLAHGPVGRNGDPRSKTRDFCDLLGGPLGHDVDVAMHKYCYVDVTAATDVDALFSDYRASMSALRARRPEVTVVHVTVPLVRVRRGPRAWIGGMLGRRAPQPRDNGRRETFNDRLRAEYCGRLPVFDLAALESHASGTRALRPDYTDDGGHLNPRGREAVATALLEMLAALPRRR